MVGTAQDQPRKGGQAAGHCLTSLRRPDVIPASWPVSFSNMEVCKMDFSQIVQLIGQLGFPIVMCIMVYKQSNETIKELRETVDKNTIATLQLANAIRERDKAA